MTCKELFIDEKSFLKLPNKEQHTLLYSNQVETLNLVRGYKFYQKLSAIVGSFILASVAFLFTIHIK